jgi:hypothetical protein
VIGELGMHGLDLDPTDRGTTGRVLAMRAAQAGVAALPEFRDSTLFVHTARCAVLNGTAYNGIYHYNGRADAYYRIGRALGQGLLRLWEEPPQQNPSGAQGTMVHQAVASSRAT